MDVRWSKSEMVYQVLRAGAGVYEPESSLLLFTKRCMKCKGWLELDASLVLVSGDAADANALAGNTPTQSGGHCCTGAAAVRAGDESDGLNHTHCSSASPFPIRGAPVSPDKKRVIDVGTIPVSCCPQRRGCPSGPFRFRRERRERTAQCGAGWPERDGSLISAHSLLNQQPGQRSRDRSPQARRWVMGPVRASESPIAVRGFVEHLNK